MPVATIHNDSSLSLNLAIAGAVRNENLLAGCNGTLHCLPRCFFIRWKHLLQWKLEVESPLPFQPPPVTDTSTLFEVVSNVPTDPPEFEVYNSA